MPVQLNHTIVHARDPLASAQFLSDLLGLDPPRPFGPFQVVEVANGVSLDYIETGPEYEEMFPQHYAFLVTEPEFDEIFGRIQERRLEYFADPAGHEAGEINRHYGGRGVYWADPDGNWLEIITVPYGGWDGKGDLA
jgi:catechol 2,3-dioxygenase-like lactoylglutathione lyase family enzyme